MALKENNIESKILLKWEEKDCFSEYTSMRLANSQDAIVHEDKRFIPDIVAKDTDGNTVYFEILIGKQGLNIQQRANTIRNTIIKEKKIKLILITDNIKYSQVGYYTIPLDLALYGVGIIRKTCNDLDITVSELAIQIGVSTQTLRNAISSKRVSSQIEKSIELLIENHKLKEELKLFDEFKLLIKKIAK